MKIISPERRHKKCILGQSTHQCTVLHNSGFQNSPLSFLLRNAQNQYTLLKGPSPLLHSFLRRNKSSMFLSHVSAMFFLLLLTATSTIAEKCQHPPPAENFSNQLYAGQWFEVVLKLMLVFQVKTFPIPGGEIPDDRRGHFPDWDSLY